MISGLYLITDNAPKERLFERVAAALRGGVRLVQYRDKERSAAEQTQIARELLALCRAHGALLLINDSAEIAKAAGADGVHIGQGDGSVAEARTLLGPGKLLGVSTHNAAEAKRAAAEGADYIGFGSIFPTGSKDDIKVVGVEPLREMRRAVTLPIVALGGINAENAGAVVDAGADSVAVISAVMGDPDPTLAARELALAFNRLIPFPRGRVLTVAGSDSGGGAGIQADLKTITLLGGYGMSALTALTAQNTLGVKEVHPVPATFVATQMTEVLGDLGADVVKSGMLFGAEIVRTLARQLVATGLPAVVDPVMIAKGGAPLLQPEAVVAFCEELLPRTYLLTPNLPEAEALTGLRIAEPAAMEEAAWRLHEMGARNVLVKGGHLSGEAIDVLLSGGAVQHFAAPRIETAHTHGTGCTYAAAIATFLAQGLSLQAAVARAKRFVHEAISAAVGLGHGHGPVNHWAAALKTVKSSDR